MDILYYSPGAASLAVHWMLLELDLPHELRLVDFEARAQHAPGFLALNPAGHVPVLVMDGTPCTEVAALLMLLAERYGEARFDIPAAAPDRAEYLRTMVFLANTLQPAFRAWFYPHEPAGPENAEAAMAAARARVETAFARLDDQLSDGRPFILGKRVTAADLLLTMLARWSRNMPRPATEWPNLKRYLDAMRARPALREVHAREGLVDWIDG